MDTLTKRPPGDRAALAEAAGLRWLREGSDIVVKVIAADEHSLTIERIASSRPTPEHARIAGRELAKIHDCPVAGFGAPPEGWDGPNYIGRRQQQCQLTEEWAPFYAEQRVLPFAQVAVDNGNLDQAGMRTVEKALEALCAADMKAEPARIHGDLWAGNLLFGPQGPALIDPAAHGGHRETDLAMLALFGAPYLEEIRAGYQEVHPLEPGWLENTPIHQLHPLAVHAAGHGPSYGHELVQAAEATLHLV
ncbi:fructosamine kinase family protein [Corynebacterium tapiri]|uniref:Fructosamine kinase n=1 Tax=Corynebacterium tapiri TaxID=1448266 RepID=A0A5C4U1S5_9CORY|nr:fructosamine kinase family protein [Corynebacterium tapiri]TNL95625.1 fructosamine kinase [Corynebacterium tapiri]